MPFPNEHSGRLKSPNMPHEFGVKRTKGSGRGKIQGVVIPTSISVIWFIRNINGNRVPVAQALRFPFPRWSASEARSWIRDHQIRIILFEKASKEK